MLLAVPDEIISDLSHYTREPKKIVSFRDEVGDTLELLKKKLENE